MTNRKADIYTGIVSILIAAAFYVQGRELELHSNIFPLLLELFLVLTGGYLVYRGITCKGTKCSESTNLDYRRAFIMILATIIYIAGINVVGFYVTSFVFLTLMSWYLSDRGMTLQSLGISTGFAVILTSAVYATFTLFLGVPTPVGILF
ncbi:MAG: tripartite tricarboxylate transporter TctB family protein [Bacillota bacterium]